MHPVSPKEVALVTGASSGLGEVFARKLSAKGYRLILVARREDRLRKLAEELRESEIVAADLTVDADLRKVEERIESEASLEFLVNNAGFGLKGAFFETSFVAQDKMHRLHITATERLTHAALGRMLENRKGNIINVSSVAGFLATPYNVSYCATKAWINFFTEGLYLELKAINSPVRIQALCPGFTHSEFHQSAAMDASVIPRILWLSPEYVVDTSLRSLERNRPIVIPSLRYRLFTAMYPLVPRSLKHALALRYGRARQG